jgi:hypothetical protein
MIARLLIVALILIAAPHLFAQKSANLPKDSRTAADQELEAVVTEARNLDNKNAIVNIRSKAAMLVSFSDPVRSQKMFLEVWKFVNDQTDGDFDKQQAKLVILKYLFPRNPKLARQLLAEPAKPEESSLQSRAAGSEDQRLAGRLASQLVDTDPSAAASLLERSLSPSPTIAAMGALTRLRERDSFLSDYVAAKALEGLTNQPTLVSLPGVTLLTGYVFPGPDVSLSSSEAELSLESLQFKYFLSGYEVLRVSLNETNEALLKDQHYAQRDLQYRAVYQGQIAAILAALAPRFQPSLTVELTNVASKLAPQVPANISQMTQFALARLNGNKFASEDPEQSFLFALSNGDFDEAEKQVDNIKDDKKKSIYTQLLHKNHARALLAKSDVLGALTLIRKLEDSTARLVMYLDASKIAKKKHDSDLTNVIINEARLLVPQVDRNGLHVRALLSFAAQLTGPGPNDDAFDFLNDAVTSINALSKKTNDGSPVKTRAEAAMAELNDPNNLLDSSEMEQAFSLVGLRDLDRGLAQARRLEFRPVQLIARLEAIQGIIRLPSSKPKVINLATDKGLR